MAIDTDKNQTARLYTIPGGQGSLNNHQSDANYEYMGDDKTHYVTKDLLAAHLAAVEARTETQFSDLRGEMKVGFAGIVSGVTSLSEKMSEAKAETRSSRAWIIGTILTVALTIGGMLLAEHNNVIASFSAGLTARPYMDPPGK